jgi:hypothetical protein
MSAESSWEELFSRLFSDVIEIVEKNVEEENRKEFYSDLIELISIYDEDIFDDLMGLSISFDEAFFEHNPNAFDDFIEDLEEDE